MGRADLVSLITKNKSIRILTDTSLDSLLAAGILMKTLREHNFTVRVTLDAKTVIDERDFPTIMINLPPLNQSMHASISYERDHTATGSVASTLDDLFALEWWDKALSIVAGLYRGLYDFKEGKFKGVEDRILRELLDNKKLEEAPTLPRAWGIKRVGFVSAFRRTLIPFMQGFTGNPDSIRGLASKVFGKDPDQLRNIDASNEKELDLLLNFLMELAKALNLSINELSNKILGDFVIPPDVFGELELQLSEAMGGLLVFGSLFKDSPLHVVSVSLDPSILPSILSIYDSYIDEASSVLGMVIPEWLAKRGDYIDVEEYFERPGLIVDILADLNALPPNKPVSILYNGQRVTELRELLRIGVKPEEAYTLCDEVQLCVVKQ
ncbi:hypothetical protein [Desulfurococcus mucosus]|uniref:Phosphoesterase, RecJ domain protein n=1 Tax=Desulfurococcus mucosus (strain ATCC 35584 / DSM 2162 / JCM 9187 / O7/1) TaxID=765177 RepID=E8R7F7_DESM0|nr:hypothetical protein [Desulfurococcus mucosus]ADV65622.1 phosphoesterase, RecJ domain protein [Desulfurococcus mucosus DSM 2162]